VLEQKLDVLRRANAVHLRAAYFMENSLGTIGIIKSQGFNAGAFRADLAVPMIATRDIGGGRRSSRGGFLPGQDRSRAPWPSRLHDDRDDSILGGAIGKPT